MVLHLPKIHSDHRPLLIRHEKSFSSHVGLKPFKILRLGSQIPGSRTLLLQIGVQAVVMCKPQMILLRR